MWKSGRLKQTRLERRGGRGGGPPPRLGQGPGNWGDVGGGFEAAALGVKAEVAEVDVGEV